MTAGTVTSNHAQDIEYARALHGDKIKSGLLANLSSKNAQVHNATTDAYLNLWKKEVKNETKEHEENRKGDYTTLVNSYYNLATDFYEYGMCTGSLNSRVIKLFRQVGVPVSTFAVSMLVKNLDVRLLVMNTIWLPTLVSSKTCEFLTLAVV
jgi:hypothetical protein